MRLLGPLALITLLPSIVSPQRVYVRSPQISRVPSYGSVPSGGTTYHFTDFSTGNIPSGSFPSDTAGNIIVSGGAPVEWNFSSLPFDSSQNAVGNKGPVSVVFLRSSGTRITISEPVERSSMYRVKFLININKAFNGIKEGEWHAEVDIPRGNPLSYEFPDIKLRQADTIYYWVIINGRDGPRSWYREYTGYYQVPDRNPHGPGQPLSNSDPSTPDWPVQPPPSSGVGPISPIPQEIPTYPVDNSPQESQRPSPVRPSPSRPSPLIPPPPRLSPRPMTDLPTECIPSSTTYNGNANMLCAGDRFDKYAKFQAIERFPDEHEPEETFTLFTKDMVATTVSDGQKMYSVVPSLLEDTFGPRYVDKSHTLSQCTARSDLCHKAAVHYNILPPILSGRYTTENSLSFKYGIVEMKVKLPRGDWIVPEIWLLPRNQMYGNDSGRIILAMSRGNRDLTADGRDYSGRVLEAGVEIGSKPPIMFRKTRSNFWFDDFHDFKLIWTPDKMQFFVDNDEIGMIQAGRNGVGPNMRPFDQEFYLVLGAHVGGDKDFPDTPGKPWVNYDPKNKVRFNDAGSRAKWVPTWDGAQGLYVFTDIIMKASNV